MYSLEQMFMLIVAFILFCIIPVLIVAYLLYVLFNNRKRIKMIELRLADLEKLSKK